MKRERIEKKLIVFCIHTFLLLIEVRSEKADALRKWRGTFIRKDVVLKQIDAGISNGNDLAVGHGHHWIVQACA